MLVAVERVGISRDTRELQDQLRLTGIRGEQHVGAPRELVTLAADKKPISVRRDADLHGSGDEEGLAALGASRDREQRTAGQR